MKGQKWIQIQIWISTWSTWPTINAQLCRCSFVNGDDFALELKLMCRPTMKRKGESDCGGEIRWKVSSKTQSNNEVKSSILPVNEQRLCLTDWRGCNILGKYDQFTVIKTLLTIKRVYLQYVTIYSCCNGKTVSWIDELGKEWSRCGERIKKGSERCIKWSFGHFTRDGMSGAESWHWLLSCLSPPTKGRIGSKWQITWREIEMVQDHPRRWCSRHKEWWWGKFKDLSEVVNGLQSRLVKVIKKTERERKETWLIKPPTARANEGIHLLLQLLHPGVRVACTQHVLV